MSLRLHDTLTRSLRSFEPLRPGRVGIYGCGPTVYGRAHIGNFRAFLVYDLLHRYLEWLGYEVRFVVNLTDVDDRIVQLAAERGQSIREFAAPHVESFLADADTLGMRAFDSHPRATGYIREMTQFVSRLIGQGLAYPTSDGSVYFRIAGFPGTDGSRASSPMPCARVSGWPTTSTKRTTSVTSRSGRRPSRRTNRRAPRGILPGAAADRDGISNAR